MKKHGFIVCFLDILGFKRKLETIGIDEIEKRYDILTESIRSINNRHYEFFPDTKMESPIWIQDNNNLNLTFLYRVYLHYASDSIILWSDRNWEIYNHIENEDQIPEHQKWVKYPKPCDPFIDLCNEIMCKGLEIGLPLRGSISIGDGRFNFKTNKFIGKVINDCSIVEKLHNHVGIAMSSLFLKQIIPNRYKLEFEHHIKDNISEDERSLISSFVVDWPRHWRNTRTALLNDYLNENDFKEDPTKYEITLKMMEESTNQRHQYNEPSDFNVFEIYKDVYRKSDAFPIRLMK